MERQVQQLVEMVCFSLPALLAPSERPYRAQGATVAQARAALKQYSDVMQAAERIFDGKFDNVLDEDGDVEMASNEPAPAPQRSRMVVRRLRMMSCV